MAIRAPDGANKKLANSNIRVQKFSGWMTGGKSRFPQIMCGTNNNIPV